MLHFRSLFPSVIIVSPLSLERSFLLTRILTLRLDLYWSGVLSGKSDLNERFSTGIIIFLSGFGIIMLDNLFEHGYLFVGLPTFLVFG